MAKLADQLACANLLAIGSSIAHDNGTVQCYLAGERKFITIVMATVVLMPTVLQASQDMV